MALCPLCGIDEPQIIREMTAGDAKYYKCPRCGTYRIGGLAETLVPRGDPEIRSRLSAVTRLATERGQQLSIVNDDVESLAASAPRWSTLADAVDRLLLLLATRAASFIAPVRMNWKVDYPLLVAYEAKEAEQLMIMAGRMGFVDNHSSTITVAGWQRVDDLRQHQPRARQAFVAMWFDESMRNAWTGGFKPGIEASKYFEATRIDLVQHNEKIDDRIIAEIRRSGLVIADFTGHRGGVYFEAGYALGLGLPVIWTCRQDYLETAHFDTRQYNHLVWTDPPDLARRLADRIAATVLPVRAHVA